jgi:DNA-binding IclR family transcriptional regulator
MRIIREIYGKLHPGYGLTAQEIANATGYNLALVTIILWLLVRWGYAEKGADLSIRMGSRFSYTQIEIYKRVEK